MLVPEKVSLSDFVSRRLHPTKVVLAYIRHEMNVHAGPSGVTIVTQASSTQLRPVASRRYSEKPWVLVLASMKVVEVVDPRLCHEPPSRRR